MKKAMFIRIAVCLMSFTTLGSYAEEENNWQVAIGVGTASASESLSSLNADIEDSDTSITFDIGYRLTQKLTIHAGYTDLGDASATFNIQSTQSGLQQELQQALGKVPILGNGFTIGASYAFLDRENWQMEINTGLYHWDADISTTANGVSINREEDGTDVILGIGALRKFDVNYIGYVKLQRYFLNPNNVDEIQLGMVYQF